MYLAKFQKNIPKEVRENDYSGILFDEPIANCIFITNHARKRCQERNISKEDALKNKSSAHCIIKNNKIVTVLGNNFDHEFVPHCHYCKEKGHKKINCIKLNNKKKLQQQKKEKEKNKKKKKIKKEKRAKK